MAFAEPHQGEILSVPTEEESELPEEAVHETRNALDSIDLGDAPTHLHRQIKALLSKHDKMWDSSLGVIHSTEHGIVTPPGTVPIRAQPYRTGAVKCAINVDQINKMLHLKVIKPSHSDWASPVVIVPMKNGKARFCVDYRRWNNITKKDASPLPCMKDCLDSLEDAEVFTSLYCTAGYWQVPLRKENNEKTAFTTYCGMFDLITMPIGLTNAPATFQHALDSILSGLKWQICLVYLEDVIIFSSSAKQHIKDVDLVLTRLRDTGVTLNLEKCKRLTKEVEYLDHTISPGKLHVLNVNTEALRQAKFPRTKTQLRSFLGMCNLYRRIVLDFTKRARALNALTQKEVPPDLPPRSAESQAAFEDLRDALVHPPILALPKAGRELTLDVYASSHQLSCTLLQDDDEGKPQQLGYWRRSIEAAELSYSTTERECFGIVWTVLKLRLFLEGQHFIIRSDSQNLSWMYRTVGSTVYSTVHETQMRHGRASIEPRSGSAEIVDFGHSEHTRRRTAAYKSTRQPAAGANCPASPPRVAESVEKASTRSAVLSHNCSGAPNVVCAALPAAAARGTERHCGGPPSRNCTEHLQMPLSVRRAARRRPSAGGCRRGTRRWRIRVPLVAMNRDSATARR